MSEPAPIAPVAKQASEQNEDTNASAGLPVRREGADPLALSIQRGTGHLDLDVLTGDTPEAQETEAAKGAAGAEE